jgi:hypothetical protein
MKIIHTENVEKLRREEYPGLAEFADAFYWQQRGDSKRMEEWLKKCDSVKSKYPKNPSGTKKGVEVV